MAIDVFKSRRFWMVAPLAVLLLSGAGCKRHASVDTDEESPKLASVIRMGDPRLAQQLLTGFYGIESNAWRWTAQTFVVVLRTPPGAAEKGARLVFRLSVPDPVIQQLRSVTLVARVGIVTMPPATYSKTGGYTYEQTVPANAFQGDTTRVEFTLDRAIPPGTADHRQLGLIANSVGLLPLTPPVPSPANPK